MLWPGLNTDTLSTGVMLFKDKSVMLLPGLNTDPLSAGVMLFKDRPVMLWPGFTICFVGGCLYIKGVT